MLGKPRLGMTGKFRAGKRGSRGLSEGLRLGRAEGEESFLRPHYERRSCPAVSRVFFFFSRMTESGPLPWDMLPWAERAEAGWGRRQTDWCFP